MNEAGGPLPLEQVRRGAAWLCQRGDDHDVVVSTRIRLARNLAGLPFNARANQEQRRAVIELVRGAIERSELPGARGVPPQITWSELHRLAPLDRTLLMERHLISKEHAKLPNDGSAGPRAVAISMPDEGLSIMVNEEDHLRMQVLGGGRSLESAWARADAVDDQLEAALDYAYSPRFGYLTACPTNVGCGVRMSVMLHLPGLRLTGELEKVKRAARDMTLAVRGFYGEGSDAVGDLFQISNQTTLGKAEGDILRELDKQILPEVIEYERASRRLLIERRTKMLEDQVFRALGTLRYARLLAPEEALTTLSMVRLGVLTGLIADLDEVQVTQLFVLSQPAHLQRVLGRELDQQQRREARAEFLRQRLTPAAGGEARA